MIDDPKAKQIVHGLNKLTSDRTLGTIVQNIFQNISKIVIIFHNIIQVKYFNGIQLYCTFYILLPLCLAHKADPSAQRGAKKAWATPQNPECIGKLLWC